MDCSVHLRRMKTIYSLRWLLAVFFLAWFDFARGASPQVVPSEIKDGKLAEAGVETNEVTSL
jgi:hypothetical protein